MGLNVIRRFWAGNHHHIITTMITMTNITIPITTIITITITIINNNIMLNRKESRGEVFSPNYPFPYQVNVTWLLSFHHFNQNIIDHGNWLSSSPLSSSAADSLSVLHLRDARLAELGACCAGFWQVRDSFWEDGQVYMIIKMVVKMMMMIGHI